MTNITKHTPGPWIVSSHPTANTYNLEIKHNDNLVAVAACQTWGYGATATRLEAQANARLIAAAPELLEALRACEEELRLWANGINHRNMNKAKVSAKYGAIGLARTAIAKAEGKKDENSVITIEVKGGMVTEVSGLPDGYSYEINDLDNR